MVQKAKCVVIVPGVKKGALGVGGQYGRGYLVPERSLRVRLDRAGGDSHRRRQHRPAIGGTDTDVFLLVMNDRGVDG